MTGQHLDTIAAWLIAVVGFVGVVGYYIAGAMKHVARKKARWLAQSDADFAEDDLTAVARAHGYPCLPLLTEERVREESAPLVVDAEWAAMNRRIA